MGAIELLRDDDAAQSRGSPAHAARPPFVVTQPVHVRMDRCQIVLLDVFTNRPFGGNPLAVVTGADELTPAQMQIIAAECNLSETVFVLQGAGDADFALRIFTPRMELPFAGHPTIGAAVLLASRGDIPVRGDRAHVALAETAGIVKVSLTRSESGTWAGELAAPGRPTLGRDVPSIETAAALLQIRPEEIGCGSWRVATAECGVPFTLIPVADTGVLARVRLDHRVWESALARSWGPHVYVYTSGTYAHGARLRARMFAPAMGIAEDPATGGGAAALAGYLAAMAEEDAADLHWRIEQGIEMGRPSLIDIRVDRIAGVPSNVRVGGEAVIVGEGWMRTP